MHLSQTPRGHRSALIAVISGLFARPLQTATVIIRRSPRAQCHSREMRTIYHRLVVRVCVLVTARPSPVQCPLMCVILEHTERHFAHTESKVIRRTRCAHPSTAKPVRSCRYVYMDGLRCHKMASAISGAAAPFPRLPRTHSPDII